MNGTEHHREADRLIAVNALYEGPTSGNIALAQVHAILALTAPVGSAGVPLLADAKHTEQWSVRKSSAADGEGVSLPYNGRNEAENDRVRFLAACTYPVTAQLVRRDVYRWPDGAVFVTAWEPEATP
ncbi:hypothetical protein BDK92_7147 [Micromonospora pisi]|uniref:Uncharacterized protein n=1 Tax=Micromonospora pisi TaxID=589240 RepID=A0A495JV14_9ACTN|nr:hypothetical protein [Micromonospora pisi]RKR92671.1 hypothetical protein BDK92_7147 [Micromonospora pisi]